MKIIGLIGDYNPEVTAHKAIPVSLNLVSNDTGIKVEFEWIGTDEIHDDSRIRKYDGLWCVPASPYRSMEGALCAIKYARVRKLPFLGTCGGFQHALIEYARNVLGWMDAQHAETAPDATRLVITQLECALVETTSTIRFVPGSKIASFYKQDASSEETFRCRFGLNPSLQSELLSGMLRASANDYSGEVRAVELVDDHPFYVATLFQPERVALQGLVPPLVRGFVQAL